MKLSRPLLALVLMAAGCSSPAAPTDPGGGADVPGSVTGDVEVGSTDPADVAETSSGAGSAEDAVVSTDVTDAAAAADAASTAGVALVVRNARVFTADAGNTFVSAIAVDDGAIVWVGDDADSEAYVGSGTKVVDLDGRLVLPGLHDVHQHPLEAHLDVIDCLLDPNEWDPEDYSDDLVGCAPSETTGWVLGWGFSVLTIVWATRPPREILDEVFPDTPVAIMEETSHSTMVNTAGLVALGIDADTPNPPGGIIVKDDAGQPNGLLVDSAGEWPWDSALEASPALDAENYKALLAGQDDNSKHGITSAVDARVYLGRGHLAAYERAAAEDALSVRMVLALWAYADADDSEQIPELSALLSDDGGLLRVRQVKLYSDGLTQNTTAALLEPYVAETWGPPTGLNYFEQSRLEAYAKALQAVGFDLHIHTIGDRAVREALNAIEATRGDPGGATARHHLTHVELVHPDDVPRFGALDVLADMQMSEWTMGDRLHDSDELIGAERVDERSWPLASLREAGATVALSSDYDVGSLSPFDGMEVALTRGVQALPDVAAAVKAYTIDAARIMRSEDLTGSLEVGKRADLVVLDQDIFKALPQKIGGTNVLWTLLDGEEVYRAGGFTP